MAYTDDPFLACYSLAQPRLRLRLFCFPFAGAGASIFREWSSALPPDVQVFGVQLPGRENRLLERPFTRMTVVAGAIVEVLQRYPHFPFAFFGHSVGALIAFEVARELWRCHRVGPVHLIVSGHQGPSRPPLTSPIHQLPDLQLIEELRRLGGTPRDVLENAELMDALLPAIRADFEVAETYEYQPQTPLQCPISVFGGLHDTSVRNSDLPAWQQETLGPCVIRMFPGDHYFIRSCRVPLLRAVAERLCIG